MESLVVALAALVLGSSPFGVGEWEEIANKEGVVIKTRTITKDYVKSIDPNVSNKVLKDLLEMKEVSSSVTIPTDAKTVWETINDFENYADFMPYVVETEAYEHDDKDLHYEWAKISPPIVSNRDYVVKIKSETYGAPDLYIRTWIHTNEAGPKPKKGIVRVPFNAGEWLIQQDGDVTHVTYRILTYPGGSIPNWIARKANRDAPHDLLRNLQSRSLNPSWTRDDDHELEDGYKK